MEWNAKKESQIRPLRSHKETWPSSAPTVHHFLLTDGTLPFWSVKKSKRKGSNIRSHPSRFAKLAAQRVCDRSRLGHPVCKKPPQAETNPCGCLIQRNAVPHPAGKPDRTIEQPLAA